jgi:uncharacterized repeat protein (TIGR01451 family)
MLAAMLLVPAVLFAWGPSRTTYTMAKPADHVVFNSITDNPEYGDERQFTGIKDNANTNAGGWQNTITAQPGHEYLVRVYVHNNAASNLNLVAKNTRVTAALSTATSTSVPITTYVSADNAEKVWADVRLSSNEAFNIAYVSGSAVFYNNVTGQAGRSVSDSLVNPGGALVGYQSNNGDVPGCMQYAGYLTFKVKAQFAPPSNGNFTVSKEVSKHGANQWVENYVAQPGETVDYLLEYKNTGTVVQNDVMISDQLPAGMTYVAGSTILGNPTNPGGVKTNEGVTAGGINVGGYNPGQNAWVIFSAKAPELSALACGTNSLVNTEKVVTDYGTKTDTATVTVAKACQTHPGVTITKKVNNAKTAVVKAGVPFEYEITVTNTGDVALVNAKVSDAAPAGITFLSADKGTIANNVWNATVTLPVGQSASFKISAVASAYIAGVTTNKACVDATEVSGNPDACDMATTTMEKDITVCRLSDYQIVTIKESEFSTNKYSKNLDDCKKITACRLSDQQIVTIRESEFDSSKYSKDLDKCRKITVCELGNKKIVTITVAQYNQYKDRYSTDLNKCKEVPNPGNVQVCRLDDKKIVVISDTEYNANKSKYSMNLNDCASKPAMCTVPGKETLPANSPDCVPTELPHTGISEGILSAIGAGSLVGAFGAFMTSRRALKQN